MAAAVSTQTSALPTPRAESSTPPTVAQNGTPNGLHGRDVINGFGAFPASKPPAPASAAPTPGSESPATPMQIGTPLLTAQPQLRNQSLPSQLSPIHTGFPGNRLPASYNGKVAIVDPPRQVVRRSSHDFTPAFGSPIRDHLQVNPKFNEDVSRLTHAVQQSIPEAVRHVVRDNWEKTLLGTEYHQAYVMNVSIHHATGLSVRRAIKDFGKKMVSESKHDMIRHFTAQDVDEVADLILERASDSFLDKALERRLGTIDARSLINALARAERLGYEDDDAMDERPDLPPINPGPYPSAMNSQSQIHYRQQAQPLPSLTKLTQSTSTTQLKPLQGPPRPVLADLQCPLCWRKFTAASPYEYHVKKQLCTKQPPTPNGYDFSCEHCGAGFITLVGQQYHHTNRVCGDHTMASATPEGDVTMENSTTVSGVQRPAVRIPPASQIKPSPSISAYHASPSAPPPPPIQQYSYTPSSTPRAPPSSGPLTPDPYAHLTPQVRAQLEDELRKAEEMYAPRFKAADELADPNERKNKYESLQNTFSTKQSNIRRKYGVKLRQRRTKVEIEAERARIHAQSWGNTPSAKRQRIDSGAENEPAWRSARHSASSTPPVSSAAHAVEASPSKHLSVADMNSSGLGGSTATAATADPTIAPSQRAVSPPAAANRSLSSMQKSGYRISTHTSRRSASTDRSPEPVEEDSRLAPLSTVSDTKINTKSPARVKTRGGSASEPVVLEDESPSSSDDSGSDEDIPAHIPPSRIASTTPQEG